MPATPLSFITSGMRFVTWVPADEDVMRLAFRCVVRNGIRRFQVVDPSNDPARLRRVAALARGEGMEQVVLGLTYSVSQVHTHASSVRRCRPWIPPDASTEGLAEPIVASGFLPDGAHAFAVTQFGKVRLWNVATGAQTKGFEHDGKVLGAIVSGDGKTLVLVGDESVFELWDLATGTLARHAHQRGAADLAMLSPDGSKLGMGGDDITIWNPATGRRIAQVPIPNDELVTVMKWTATGTSMVVADGNGNVSILDTGTWRPRIDHQRGAPPDLGLLALSRRIASRVRLA